MKRLSFVAVLALVAFSGGIASAQSMMADPSASPHAMSGSMHSMGSMHKGSMKSDSMKSHAMKSDSMKSDSMKSDSMKSDSMKSSSMGSSSMSGHMMATPKPSGQPHS